MGLDIELYVVKEDGEGGIREEIVYEANITHNLDAMARRAGIYFALWQPDEIDITFADQLAPVLTRGLATMLNAPHRFVQFDAPTGWGTYDQFLPWLCDYIRACAEYPNARIRTCR